jgi:Galactose-3-O-sulfotransferase
VIYGHVSYGIHRELGVENFRYATILREPVARAVSFFRHQARYEDSDYHALISDGMTLKDLLLSERCDQLNNHMVRIISGHGDPAVIEERVHLERAFANIDAHFAAVGITEHMDESVALMAGALKWTTRPAVKQLNVDTEADRYVIDDETRALVERYNALDLELYERFSVGWP